jgi:hypothetical protein
VEPRYQTDEFAARLAVPSVFRVLIRATGVPKYRTDGSITV